MELITLQCESEEGEPQEAIFCPDVGMNLFSFKKGNIEVIDPSTRDLFEERSAGLGALIGPHFHHRNPSVIPSIKDETLFPHIARVKAKGVSDPFSYGIARYAPWKAHSTPRSLTARITGKDIWNTVPLSTLEGQNFTMEFRAILDPKGLKLHLSVVSDADSLAGIHYYYHIPNGTGKVISQVQSSFIDNNERKQIPPEWDFDSQHKLTYDLRTSADFTFHPFPNPLEGVIELDAEIYRLITRYTCSSQENSWQLYHPEGASFVCIVPITSQDPWHPNLTVSSIGISLEIIHG